jgi:putative aldouronate transport system permease protein
MKNTLGISVYQLFAGFPLPIILALMLNQLKNGYFKRFTQTVTYAPHFISIVVLIGLLEVFLNPRMGLVNTFFISMGKDPVYFLGQQKYFWHLYVLSGIWQNTGWAAIMYLAALSGIDPELYEAAKIDGATRFQRILYIDIPGILPTIVILFILNTGRLMNIGFEKTFLMQNPLNLGASEVISTYVYKVGLIQAQFGFASAVGLFNGVINLVLLVFMLLVIIYPLYFTIVASFSDPQAIYQGRVWLFPAGFTVEGYQRLLIDPAIPRGYFNTIIITGGGTLLSVFLTLNAAFALSNRYLSGKKIFIGFFAFTMFFNGGMIPTYLLIRNLGLLNTFWALILPGTVGAWNLFLVRTFYQSTIPLELYEAAIMDGASVTVYYYRIVLPLSKAIVSVMVLYYAVGYWNLFFPALLYIRDEKLYPLQLVLRNIILENEALALSDIDAETVAARQRVADLLKYSSMIVASIPLLAAYPFLQKYFSQGVMVGSVKG